MEDYKLELLEKYIREQMYDIPPKKAERIIARIINKIKQL